LQAELDGAPDVPATLREALSAVIERAVAFAERVANDADEVRMRQASSALYHATSATLLAAEGARLGRLGRDARRLIVARMVLDHRLRAPDPLQGEASDPDAVAALLDEAPVPLAQAQALV
jgi:acyl-CoA dehydrogenase